MHKQSITKLHDNIMMQVSAITIEVKIFGKEWADILLIVSKELEKKSEILTLSYELAVKLSINVFRKMSILLMYHLWLK